MCFGGALSVAIKWRKLWRETSSVAAQPDLDPEWPVFIDETGASTKMAPAAP